VLCEKLRLVCRQFFLYVFVIKLRISEINSDLFLFECKRSVLLSIFLCIFVHP
jgi:hypothetical protein